MSCSANVGCVNYYECPCGFEWFDEWDCECDDKCPNCNKACSPTVSEWMDEDATAQSMQHVTEVLEGLT